MVESGQCRLGLCHSVSPFLPGYPLPWSNCFAVAKGNLELDVAITREVLIFWGWSMGCVKCLGGVSFPMGIKLLEVEYKKIRRARNLEEFK